MKANSSLRKRSTRVVACLAATTLFFAGGLAANAATGPSVTATLSGSQAQGNQIIEVVGRGFTPSSVVSVVSAMGGTSNQTPVTVDGSGTASVDLSVFNGSRGTMSISVQGGNKQARTTVNIVADASSSTSSDSDDDSGFEDDSSSDFEDGFESEDDFGSGFDDDFGFSDDGFGRDDDFDSDFDDGFGSDFEDDGFSSEEDGGFGSNFDDEESTVRPQINSRPRSTTTTTRPRPRPTTTTTTRAPRVSTSSNGLRTTQRDDLPWRTEQILTASPLGMFKRECTDFALWRINQMAGSTSAPFEYHNSDLRLGNASEWKAAWDRLGWDSGNTPRVGAVAWYGANEGVAGSFGHVGIVSAINGSNVTIEEYNFLPDADHAYHVRTASASSVSSFLYFPG